MESNKYIFEFIITFAKIRICYGENYCLYLYGWEFIWGFVVIVGYMGDVVIDGLFVMRGLINRVFMCRFK